MPLPSLRPRLAGQLAYRIAIAALAAVLVTGCSGRRVAEFFLVGSHFDLVEGVRYGEQPRQQLDVYSPQGLDRPAPVLVFLYGGRWQTGSREIYRLLGDALTRRGIVTVVADYTLYPDTIFPGWVEEAATAVAWTRDSITDYGGDPNRIFIAGHSAGAHTAALLALDPSYLHDAGIAMDAISGVVGISGPVSTTWTDEDVQILMGPESGRANSYPENHVGESDSPPLLLLHGGDDETVSAGNSVRLADSLRAVGSCARAIVYPGIGHVEIIVALMAPWLNRASVRDDIAGFVADPLGAACGGVGASPAAGQSQ